MRSVRGVFRRFRNEDGASIVEIAVVSSIFFAMLIGAFQMMLALYTFHFVSEAAREGSRYAMVRGSTSCTNTPALSNCNATASQIQSYIRGIAYPGITASKLNLTTTWLQASSSYPTTWSSCAGSCNGPGNQVKVVATYAYSLSVPFVPKASLNLTSTSEMVITQ